MSFCNILQNIDAKVDDIPHHVTVHKLPVDGTSVIASHGHPGKDILPRYKAMHYQTRFDVDRLVTAFDLSSYKSAVDLGGNRRLSLPTTLILTLFRGDWLVFIRLEATLS